MNRRLSYYFLLKLLINFMTIKRLKATRGVRMVAVTKESVSISSIILTCHSTNKFYQTVYSSVKEPEHKKRKTYCGYGKEKIVSK